MFKKTAICLALCTIFSTAFFTACGKEEHSSSSSSNRVEDGFETLYTEKTARNLSVGGTASFPVNKDVGDKNYIKFELSTDVNLVGYIHYEDIAGTGKTNSEKIYIEANDREFTSFLDAFRRGAFGDFEKKITEITLQNVSETAGQVTLSAVKISDRVFDPDETLFIDDGSLKVGASLAMGGALTHVEKINAGVVEYIDKNGDVRIEPNTNPEEVTVITEEVNLINIHDYGREVQQSYYAAVDESNGYVPKSEVLYDATLRYNPIQGGSAGDKQSQIIEYRHTKNEIYIKARLSEWFLDNTLSDSYAESRYYFAQDGMMISYNRFVNFSQFTGMEETRVDGQETPAVYVAYPLNYFYCETDKGTINDPNLYPAIGSPSKKHINDRIEGPYHYLLDQRSVPADWLAFVNDKGFGIGFCMPGADMYRASRGWTSIQYSLDANQHYYQKVHGVLDGKYVPSAFADNYNYMCPVTNMRMIDFVPIEYEYAVYVGTTTEMRQQFDALRTAGFLENKNLHAWD
ncbi:MAG: hypothetical protein IJF44_00990 [Clostridia bacterium]|nr:hypothetical protein [Clostridia bacterium]